MFCWSGGPCVTHYRDQASEKRIPSDIDTRYVSVHAFLRSGWLMHELHPKVVEFLQDLTAETPRDRKTWIPFLRNDPEVEGIAVQLVASAMRFRRNDCLGPMRACLEIAVELIGQEGVSDRLTASGVDQREVARLLDRGAGQSTAGGLSRPSAKGVGPRSRR